MKKKGKMNIDKSTLSEKVSSLISDMILKGIFKPGERLTETGLSKTLGFSRTPIREALRSLEKEGFVYIIPRKGATVTLLTDRDIEEIFLLKYKLETLAVVLAIEHIDSEDIAYLEHLNKKLRELKKSKSISNDILSFFNLGLSNNKDLISCIGNSCSTRNYIFRE